jgi:glucose-1-phosphate thymidylyltransferase/bifunctional UDP-N-acetylglucosamine pyrophosphorylase/glucosamine-1-phosphate N-acetyltransferase
MKALILAGGRGSRLNEFTKDTNKSMIPLFKKPLIEYNLQHAFEAGVEEIVILIGYKGENIKNWVKNDYKGIPIKYAFQKERKGLVHAIECARKEIGDSDFILMLGDEIIPNARMKEMVKRFYEEDLFCLCGVIKEEDKSSIRKTYSAMINENGRAFRLIEKPRVAINKIKGTGHCMLRNEIFEYIEKTPINANRGEKELVDLIQCSIDDGKKVYIFNISNIGYININTREDYELAKRLIKKTNPKVLIAHTQMKYLGGAELLIVELANGLTERGIKNDILALSSSKEVEKKLIDTKIIVPKNRINIEPLGFKTIKEILSFIKIYRKELKKLNNRYDVINFHNFPVTWTLFPKKRPCVWMLNEPPNLWSKPNAGLFLRGLNKLRNGMDKKIIDSSVDIICVADETNKERAENRYSKSPVIIPYGVNYNFFSQGNSENAIKKYELKGKFVILESGMISEQKNQLESLRIIKEVIKKIPHALLILAGESADKKYREKIDSFIKKNNLEKNVLFTGNLNRNDLRDLYKASDLGLFPIKKQGGGLAPLELLSAGKPIITSKEMGISAIIKKFNLGIVTEDYQKKIIEVYNSQKEYKEKSKIAAEFLRDNLQWDNFTNKMIHLFNVALKKRN